MMFSILSSKYTSRSNSIVYQKLNVVINLNLNIHCFTILEILEISKYQSSIISEGRTSLGSEINSHLQNTLNQRQQVGFGWLCFKSHRHRGHLETAPPFTVPYEVREGQLLHRSHRESNPGPSRGSPLHYRKATPAPKGTGRSIFSVDFFTVEFFFVLKKLNYGITTLQLRYVKPARIFSTSHFVLLHRDVKMTNN